VTPLRKDQSQGDSFSLPSNSGSPLRLEGKRRSHPEFDLLAMKIHTTTNDGWRRATTTVAGGVW
jgi:hypothetical protein